MTPRIVAGLLAPGLAATLLACSATEPGSPASNHLRSYDRIELAEQPCAFFGLNPNAPNLSPPDGKDLSELQPGDMFDLDGIAGTRVHRVRFNFILGPYSEWSETLLDRYDALIGELIGRGIEPVGLVNHEALKSSQAEWNDDDDGDGMNSVVLQYAATAHLLFERFGSRIKTWELWNEPNNYEHDPNAAPKSAGGAYILPRIYSHVLAETWYESRDLIESHGLRIVSGGLLAHDIDGDFSTAAPYMKDVYENGVWDWFEQATGRRYAWDYFGYHLYVMQSESWSSDVLIKYLSAVRDLCDDKGDGSPFLITEVGFPAPSGDSGSLELQRANVESGYKTLGSREDVAGVFWFSYADFNGEAWGIAGKPAYQQLASLAGECEKQNEITDDTEWPVGGEGGGDSGECPCIAGTDNVCFYGSNYWGGCGISAEGCQSDSEWTDGWYKYQQVCGS